MIQGAVVVVWQLDLQLPMQSVHIATNVVSSNPTQAIRHYVKQFEYTLENTKGAIRKGQSRETGNIWYTRRYHAQNQQHGVHKTKKNKTSSMGYTNEDKQNKNTTQYSLDTSICKQTQIRHAPSLGRSWVRTTVESKQRL